MPKHDLHLTILISYITAVFLIPTLLNTGSINKIPAVYFVLFLGFPILCVVGMKIAYLLGKRIKVLWQVAKFGLVGVLNTAMDFGLLNLLIKLTGITQGGAIIGLNASSFSLAVINSYFWNKRWVFGSKKKGDFGQFLIVTLIGISINSVTLFLLTTYTKPIYVSSPEQWANLAKVFATALSLVWNFAGYRLVVFRK